MTTSFLICVFFALLAMIGTAGTIATLIHKDIHGDDD